MEAWLKATSEAKMKHLLESPQAPGWGEWEEGMEKTDAEPQISTLCLGPDMAFAGVGGAEASNKGTSFNEGE